MNRRHFLVTAAGSALLAGCSALEDPDAEAERPPFQVDDPGESATDEDADADAGKSAFPFDEPSTVDFETAPLTATVVGGRVSTDDGLSARLEFAEPATADSPATLVSTVRNDRPYEQTFQPRRLLILDDPTTGRTADNDSVYLAPAADHPLAETEPGYYRDDDGRWRLERVGDDWFPDRLTLDAEQEVVGEYYLLGHHHHDRPPIEANRYEFSWREGSFEIVCWPTDEPGPAGDSRFVGEVPPGFPEPDDEVRWYHDATPETPVFLEPSAESVTAPAKIEFDLVNHGRESLSGNPYYWRLYKLVDDRWFPVDPWEFPLPLGSVQPGDVDETELFLYDGDPVDRQGSRTVGHLGGGQYAYAVGYSVGPETYAARFDLEAPKLVVEPEDDVAIDDEGDRIVVRLPNYGDARRPATVTVSRLESEPDPADSDETAVDERLVAEQLPRRPFRALRNSLPLFEDGVERVVVETDRGTALRRFDYEEGERLTFAYDGDAFEASGSLEEE
ncbi:hypothetical protein [Natrialba swarupiae]|uniref:Uncharacterized protein n=1 Tax=Natrialba swarupiae TaxID=2448032 RepID=A0A5D5AV95_9EURY|nr:hypothetical protein [Natrialba swarupiae]TYT63802.1 hypothetical protein FYC77_00840 [Natrialba swarupiae]